MLTTALYATTIRFGRFTPDVHEALTAGGIDVYRVPAYRNEPTDMRLELEAIDAEDARTRIRSALRDEFIVVQPHDFIVGPVAVSGERWGDGPPQ